jgi:hypothetical protein
MKNPACLLIFYQPGSRSQGQDTEVVDEQRLDKLFEKRNQTQDKWSQVECVQACVKDRIGVGTPIGFQWFSPLNEQDPTQPIDFRYD